MILSCPSCDARFQVRSEMFAKGPRKVRCARCGHQWQGEPEAINDQQPAVADEIVPETEAAPEPTDPETRTRAPFQPLASDSIAGVGADTDVPPLSEAAKAMDQKKRRRTPVWVWAGWFLLISLVAGTAIALVLARGPLISLWPPLERLYTASGMMAEPEPEVAVNFRILESTVTRDDGKNKMVVKLMIENPSAHEVPIPVAALNLIDKSGKVYHTEYVRIPGKPLETGENRPDSLTVPELPDRLADRLDRVSMVASRDPEGDS